MISQEELIKEIVRLPVTQRRVIVGRIKRSIEDSDNRIETDKFRRELSVQEKIGIAKSLSGAFKPESGYMPMTKEEDREVIMEYLEEKYG